MWRVTVFNEHNEGLIVRNFDTENEAQAWADWYRDDGFNATYELIKP